MVIIKTQTNKMVVRKLYYVPDYKYLLSKGYDISNVILGKSNDDFTGLLITKKWNDELLSYHKVKNGKINQVLVKYDINSPESNSLHRISMKNYASARTSEFEETNLQDVTVYGTPYRPTTYVYFGFTQPYYPSSTSSYNPYGTPGGTPGGGGGGGGGGSTAPSSTQTIENNIDDSDLDDCHKAILDKLKNGTTADIKSIFDKLGGKTDVYTLTFKVGNNYGNPASTNWTSPNCYKTVLDNDFLYGIDGTGINKPPTDLAIGAVMIHEMVHAYFFSLLDDKNSGITGAFDNFDLLYNNYVTKTFAGADDAQHAQIWKSFIGNLASTLQEYHTGNGTNPSQFYTDIILGTLSKTKKFKDTYPEGTVEFSRIMNTFLTEKNNGSNDPNYTPKGKPCPK
jgi:hypothetical protein